MARVATGRAQTPTAKVGRRVSCGSGQKTMDVWFDELRAGMLSQQELARVVLRLFAAMVVGGIAGIDRERAGKAAGLRTHMLVSMGAALFVLTGELGGMVTGDMSRVIQGVAAGIGFIGGGAILKSAADRQIKGLTTASSIWMTAAAGVAAGLGHIGLALVAGAFSWVILSVLTRAELWLDAGDSDNA